MYKACDSNREDEGTSVLLYICFDLWFYLLKVSSPLRDKNYPQGIGSNCPALKTSDWKMTGVFGKALCTSRIDGIC